MIVGSLWSGWQSGKVGRKKSLIINLSLICLGNVVIGFAPNFALLIIGRVFNGLGCGGME